MSTQSQKGTVRALAVADRFIDIIDEVEKNDPDGIKIARAGLFLALAVTLPGKTLQEATVKEILDYTTELAKACRQVTPPLRGSK